jgi:hypothetical protein
LDGIVQIMFIANYLDIVLDEEQAVASGGHGVHTAGLPACQARKPTGQYPNSTMVHTRW